MCVWFPLWPIQRLLSEPAGPEQASRASSDGGCPPQVPVARESVDRRASRRASHGEPPRGISPECPIVLYAPARRGLAVTACSLAALRSGIRVGMPLGEARSLLPAPSRDSRPRAVPRFEPADLAADRARLQQLAGHCQQYSPLVGLEETAEPESLWLDVAGNEALFGGEGPLIQTLQADLARQGLQARIAIADTWGAAWAVSHFGPRVTTIVPADQLAQTLAPLPLPALRLAPAVSELLRPLNVTTIGGVMQLPRAALPARFGQDLVKRLDQALGQAPELLTAQRLETPLTAEWLLEDPLTDRQCLAPLLETLLQRLFEDLQRRQAGLRELRCHWLGTTLAPLSLRLLRPTTECRHVRELLHLQCERLTFDEPLRGVRLELVEMGLPPVRQKRLFDEENPAERQQQILAELVDRLGSRLGSQSVLRPTLRPDPQPEYSCEFLPWPQTATAGPSASRSQLRCRPLCLLRAPQPLTIERFRSRPDRQNPDLPEATRTDPAGPLEASRVFSTMLPPAAVIRALGPERIETGWWRGPEERRDYYRLELSSGAVVWAYLDRGTGRWLLHGLFT